MGRGTTPRRLLVTGTRFGKPCWKDSAGRFFGSGRPTGFGTCRMSRVVSTSNWRGALRKTERSGLRLRLKRMSNRQKLNRPGSWAVRRSWLSEQLPNPSTIRWPKRRKQRQTLRRTPRFRLRTWTRSPARSCRPSRKPVVATAPYLLLRRPPPRLGLAQPQASLLLERSQTRTRTMSPLIPIDSSIPTTHQFCGVSSTA